MDAGENFPQRKTSGDEIELLIGGHMTDRGNPRNTSVNSEFGKGIIIEDDDKSDKDDLIDIVELKKSTKIMNPTTAPGSPHKG
jgi:hypothetical protein